MDAIVKCPHCHTQIKVRVRWPQTVEYCANPKCQKRLHLTFPEPCFYCAVNVADFSGDPLIGFPRCKACRKIHRFLDHAAIGLKGLFVSLLLIAIAFFSDSQEFLLFWWIVGVCSLVFGWVMGVRFFKKIPRHSRERQFFHEIWKISQSVFARFRETLKIDRLLRSFDPFKQYYRLVWTPLPLFFNSYLSLLGIGFFVATVLRPFEFFSAFFPRSATNSGHAAFTMNALLAIDGLLGWEQANLLAGLLGIAGTITVVEILLVHGTPFILGTRSSLFPHLNLKPTDSARHTQGKPAPLKAGLTAVEVERVLGFPRLKPEGSLKDELVWVYLLPTKPAGLRQVELPVFFKNGRVIRWGPQRLETFRDIRRKVGVVLLSVILATGAMLLGSHLKMQNMVSLVAEKAIKLRPGLGQVEVKELLGNPYSAEDQIESVSDPEFPLGHIISKWTYVRGVKFYIIPRYLTLQFKDGYLTSWGPDPD